MDRNTVNRLRARTEDLIGNRKTVIKLLSVLLILLTAVIFRIHNTSVNDVVIDQPEEDTARAEMYVDIGGAVLEPGVYKVDKDTRLYEVIDMAGGLTSDADTASINRAAFVEDGQKIFIPSEGDRQQEPYTDQVSDSSVSYDRLEGMVNINTADREELKTLNGIGDVLADRIIEYRASGSFRNIEEIRNVKGIGENVFNKIRGSITV